MSFPHPRRKRKLSQAQIDRQFAELTSTLDDTDFFAFGPRDYTLKEDFSENEPYLPPDLAEIRPQSKLRGKPLCFFCLLIALLGWGLLGILLPPLPSWYHWLGLGLVCALVASLVWLAKPKS